MRILYEGVSALPRFVWSDGASPEGDFLHKPEPGGPLGRPGGAGGGQRPHPLPEQPAHPPAAGRARYCCAAAAPAPDPCPLACSSRPGGWLALGVSASLPRDLQLLLTWSLSRGLSDLGRCASWAPPVPPAGLTFPGWHPQGFSEPWDHATPSLVSGSPLAPSTGQGRGRSQLCCCP